MLTDSLCLAFDRIDDFLAVQGPRIEVNKLKLLQQAADITDEERCMIVERLEALNRTGHKSNRGSVLLGVLLGLFAAQFEER